MAVLPGYPRWSGDLESRHQYKVRGCPELFWRGQYTRRSGGPVDRDGGRQSTGIQATPGVPTRSRQTQRKRNQSWRLTSGRVKPDTRLPTSWRAMPHSLSQSWRASALGWPFAAVHWLHLIHPRAIFAPSMPTARVDLKVSTRVRQLSPETRYSFLRTTGSAGHF